MRRTPPPRSRRSPRRSCGRFECRLTRSAALAFQYDPHSFAAFQAVLVANPQCGRHCCYSKERSLIHPHNSCLLQVSKLDNESSGVVASGRAGPFSATSTLPFKAAKEQQPSVPSGAAAGAPAYMPPHSKSTQGKEENIGAKACLLFEQVATSHSGGVHPLKTPARLSTTAVQAEKRQSTQREQLTMPERSQPLLRPRKAPILPSSRPMNMRRMLAAAQTPSSGGLQALDASTQGCSLSWAM